MKKVVKAEKAHERGRMTLSDCTVIFEQRINDGYGLGGRGKKLRRISENTKHYRRQTLKALWKSWPILATTDVQSISEREIEDWARKFAAIYSATR